MNKKENQHVEWKESWRDDYLKWICRENVGKNLINGAIDSVITHNRLKGLIIDSIDPKLTKKIAKQLTTW